MSIETSLLQCIDLKIFYKEPPYKSVSEPLYINIFFLFEQVQFVGLFTAYRSSFQNYVHTSFTN